MIISEGEAITVWNDSFKSLMTTAERKDQKVGHLTEPQKLIGITLDLIHRFLQIGIFRAYMI